MALQKLLYGCWKTGEIIVALLFSFLFSLFFSSEDEASSAAGSSASFQMPPPTTPTKRFVLWFLPTRHKF